MANGTQPLSPLCKVRIGIPGQFTKGIDRESNRVPSGYETDKLTIELIRNWLWELAAGFGFIVISVCYVMNADQQLLYGCTFSYGESLLQLVPET